MSHERVAWFELPTSPSAEYAAEHFLVCDVHPASMKCVCGDYRYWPVCEEHLDYGAPGGCIRCGWDIQAHKEFGPVRGES